jgi:hypothetical protein
MAVVAGNVLRRNGFGLPLFCSQQNCEHRGLRYCERALLDTLDAVKIC